jgi:hypothetical protein
VLALRVKGFPVIAQSDRSSRPEGSDGELAHCVGFPPELEGSKRAAGEFRAMLNGFEKLNCGFRSRIDRKKLWLSLRTWLAAVRVMVLSKGSVGVPEIKQELDEVTSWSPAGSVGAVMQFEIGPPEFEAMRGVRVCPTDPVRLVVLSVMTGAACPTVRVSEV